MYLSIIALAKFKILQKYKVNRKVLKPNAILM